MTRTRRVALLCQILVTAGALSGQDRGKTQAATKKAPAGAVQATTQAAADDPAYVIGPQDVLDISIWKEPDFSRVVPVRPDGRISLPLLDDIQASGLTPTQLAALISAKLRKFVTQPQVTVIVTQINSQRIYVIGEVNRPGPVFYLPGMTVLQALSTSGGFSQFANEKAVYVLRKENGREVRMPFNYKDAIRGESSGQNITLKSGDTIVVP
jgi:polysaccharide biosynthesis/export protein